jgi:recombination protein RecA
MASKKEPKIKLKALLASLKKEHGAQHFTNGDSFPAVERYSSGLFSVDNAMGGGLPKGKIVEIFGPESSGKTSLAMHLAAKAQAEGKVVCYIDAEIGFNYDFAKQVGLDVSPTKFVLVQPENGEKGLEIAMAMLDVEDIGVIVIDSVPGLAPRAMMDGAVGDNHIGLLARLMSKFCPMIVKKLDVSQCSIIFVNQLREKIGVMFGSPETTPGGRALPFYSSIRIRVRKTKFIEDNLKNVVGMRAEMHVKKNKTAPPWRKAEYELYFGTGFSQEIDMVENAIALGIITKSGSWISYRPDGAEAIQLGQGAAAAAQMLKDNPKLYKEIWKLMKKEIK